MLKLRTWSQVQTTAFFLIQWYKESRLNQDFKESAT